MRVAQDEHGQAIHGEAPDHSERIEVRKKRNVAAADDDGDDLKQYNDVDDAIAGAEARVRLTKPIAQHAILGDAVEDTVGPHDGGIDCACKNEHANDDHEAVKDQTSEKWPFKIHSQAAD